MQPIATYRKPAWAAGALLAVLLGLIVTLAPPAHAGHTENHLADSIVVSANRDKTNETLHVAAIMGTRQARIESRHSASRRSATRRTRS